MEDTLLTTKNICKDFGPVRVLDDINFNLNPGEVNALIGENGAGKSTLVKIISGYHKPTEGKLFLEGEKLSLDNIAEGEKKGIVMIHQELNLAPDLTVEENIFLGQEKKKGYLLDEKYMYDECQKILKELNCDITPKERIKDLSISNQQMVEIAKAVRKEAKVIIMDEPTSSLTKEEVKILFKLINKLKGENVGIIFISHKLDEVQEIADKVTILRDGKQIKTGAAKEFTENQMANLMVGRELEDMYPEKPVSENKKVVLEAKNISVPGFVDSASFKLYENEILGFAGLVGAGRTELLEAVVGLRERTSGQIYKRDQEIDASNYIKSIDNNIAYLSEDRKGKTLLTSKNLPFNLTLLSLEKYSDPFIDKNRELKALKEAEEKFEIQIPNYRLRADKLSGGNQQKLGVAKLMEAEPEIIIFDEPTRGIDVGTKQQMYSFIKELVTKKNKSCIVISSELQEIIGLCTRVIVMCDGKITGSLTGEQIKEEIIMQYATGLKGAV